MRFVGLILVAALAACSKPAADANSSRTAAANGQAASSSTAVAPVSGNACDRRLLTTADVSGMLGGAVTMGPLPGDAQSCVFSSGDDTVTVSLRPGLGDTTVRTVLAGGENVSATPLPGVGDRAAWTPILHEVNATKNNLLCDIQVSGGGNVSPQSVGALCNKIFAAS